MPLFPNHRKEQRPRVSQEHRFQGYTTTTAIGPAVRNACSSSFNREVETATSCDVDSVGREFCIFDRIRDDGMGTLHHTKQAYVPVMGLSPY